MIKHSDDCITASFSGPLYIWVKGHDHEIVRALETHPKAVPLEIDAWLWDLKLIVKRRLTHQSYAIFISSYLCGSFCIANYSKSRVVRF